MKLKQCKQLTAKERRIMYQVMENIKDAPDRVKEAVRLSARSNPKGFHAWMNREETPGKKMMRKGTIDRFLHDVGFHLRLVDVDKELERYKRVLDALEMVPDARLQYLMIARYLEGNTWKEVADRMHLTVSHVHPLHREAVAYLD